VLVADDHPGAAARRHVGEASAVSSGRHDVRADVAQRVELVSGGEGAEATEAASRDVLQEDALDWIGRAELENLLEPRFERLGHQGDPHTRRSGCVGALET
jgi:hypothetical protein